MNRTNATYRIEGTAALKSQPEAQNAQARIINFNEVRNQSVRRTAQAQPSFLGRIAQSVKSFLRNDPLFSAMPGCFSNSKPTNRADQILAAKGIFATFVIAAVLVFVTV